MLRIARASSRAGASGCSCNRDSPPGWACWIPDASRSRWRWRWGLERPATDPQSCRCSRDSGTRSRTSCCWDVPWDSRRMYARRRPRTYEEGSSAEVQKPQ